MHRYARLLQMRKEFRRDIPRFFRYRNDYVWPVRSNAKRTHDTVKGWCQKSGASG
jgi:hypothetical protein